MYPNDEIPLLPASQPDMVRITAAAHPLKIARAFDYIEIGKSVREVVQKLCPAEFQSSVLVFVNGLLIERDMWDTVLVAKDDIVVLRAVPQGGGAGKIFKSILSIAIIAIAVALAAPTGGLSLVSALGQTGATLAAAAFSVVGNLLLNALVPPATVANANSHSGDLPQYTFGANGIQNTELPYQTMPLIYGRTLMTPPKGAHSYTVISNNYQYLYCLFDLGPGPINISDIKIGTTPITDFADVQYETREGRPTDTPVTLYNNAVHQWPLSIGLLNNGANGTYTTPAGVSNIAIDITAPSGLFATNGTGNLTNATVTFHLKITDAISNVVAFETDIDLFGSTTSAVGNTYVVGVAEGSVGDALPVSTYNVEVTRTSNALDEYHGGTATYWTNVRSWGPASGPLLPIGNAQIAVVIRATEQLNGDITALNCIAQRYVQVTTDGVTWTEELNTHPAWAAYHALTSTGGNARALDPTRVDVDSLLTWAATYPGAEFNYVFSSRSTVWQSLRTIGSAGRAVPVIRDGLYGFVFDYVQDSPVQMFTPRNVQGFQATKTFLDEVDGMEIRYVAETMGWQQHSIYIYASGLTAETADFNYVSTLDLVGVTSDDWAYKLGSYFFAASILRTTTYQFTTDLDHLACNPGDRVLIQHDAIAQGLGSGRILSMTRDTSGNLTGFTFDMQVIPDQSEVTLSIRTSSGGIYQPTAPVTSETPTASFTFDAALDDASDFVQVGDLAAVSTTTTAMVDAIVKTITPQADFKATVTCLDYAPSVHDGDTAVVPPVVNGRIQQFYASLPCSSVTITALTAGEDDSLLATGGSAIPRIHCSFVTQMDGVAPAQYDCQFKLSTDISWNPLPSLPAGSNDFYIPISFTDIGLSYVVRVRGTNASKTEPGPWAEAELTLSNYLAAPPTPASLSVTAVISGVTATVTPGAGRAPAKYRLYEGTTNDFATSVLAAESSGPVFNISGLLATQLYYFWATTVNEFGVESAAVGPESALPLPTGADGLDGDVQDFLSYLGDAVRTANSQISDLSQALTDVGLGARVDFKALTTNYIAADSTLFANLTDGYTNAITQATGPDSSIVTEITALQASIGTVSGGQSIADVVSALQTQVTTDGTNIGVNAGAISGVQATLSGYSSTNTVNSAISNLQSEITANTSGVTSINQAITTLQNALNNGGTGLGAVSTAINSLSTTISSQGSTLTSASSAITALQNILTGYSASNTVAQAISGLATSIAANYATASSVTSLSSQVGNMYASGLFRVSTSSAPSGANARIALEVAASSGGSPYGAAIYLDAMSSGTSRVTIVADQFFLTDGSSNTSPFFFTGGNLFLNNAYVQNLTANNLAVGSVTTSALANNSATDNLVSSVGTVGLTTNSYTTLCSVTVNQNVANSPVPIEFFGELQVLDQQSRGAYDTGSPAFNVYIYRDGSAITPVSLFPQADIYNPFTGGSGSSGNGNTQYFQYQYFGIDTTCPTGSHTYAIVVLPTYTITQHDSLGDVTGTYTGSATFTCDNFSLQCLSFKK